MGSFVVLAYGSLAASRNILRRWKILYVGLNKKSGFYEL